MEEIILSTAVECELTDLYDADRMQSALGLETGVSKNRGQFKLEVVPGTQTTLRVNNGAGVISGRWFHQENHRDITMLNESDGKYTAYFRMSLFPKPTISFNLEVTDKYLLNPQKENLVDTVNGVSDLVIGTVEKQSNSVLIITNNQKFLNKNIQNLVDQKADKTTVNTQINKVITEYKNADALLKTELLNTTKADDKKITDIAQLKKITKDNGAPYYIHADGDYVSCTSMIKNAPSGYYSVRIDPTCIDSPDSTRYWMGGFYKPTNSGGYFIVQEYGGDKRLAINNWALATVTEQNFITGWKIVATTNAAQMKKITQDGGGTWYTAEGKTITEYLLSQGLGLKTLYVRANTTDAPTDVAGTGLFNIHSGNTTAIYGIAFYIVSNRMYYQHINGTLKREAWQILPVQSEIKAIYDVIDASNITTRTGTLKHGTASTTGKTSMYEYWKQMPLGGVSGYIPGGSTLLPTGAQSLRYMGHKSNNNDATHGAGLGFAFGAASVAPQPVPYVSMWHANNIANANWEELALQKNISVQRNGSPTLILNVTTSNLTGSATTLRTSNGNGVYTFYSNANCINTPYSSGVSGGEGIIGTIQIFGNYISIDCANQFGDRFSNFYDESIKKWAGWACTGRAWKIHSTTKNALNKNLVFTIPANAKAIRFSVPNSPDMELYKGRNEYVEYTLSFGSTYNYNAYWKTDNQLYITCNNPNSSLIMDRIEIAYG